jgi:hypoxanthine phosphoribosyltransferase
MEDIIQIKELSFKKLLSKELIKKRVKELAKRIDKDYCGKNPILLLTLKGAIIFAADLMREMKIPTQIETIIAKSYGMNLSSEGKVEVIENPINLNDKDIIIIEDIVDTGYTMQSLIKRLESFNPSSIEICTLLFKPKNIVVPLQIKYIGFEIEPLFVVGYGLDYAEEGRNLREIYIKVD